MDLFYYLKRFNNVFSNNFLKIISFKKYEKLINNCINFSNLENFLNLEFSYKMEIFS